MRASRRDLVQRSIEYLIHACQLLMEGRQLNLTSDLEGTFMSLDNIISNLNVVRFSEEERYADLPPSIRYSLYGDYILESIDHLAEATRYIATCDADIAKAIPHLEASRRHRD